jgi:PAS domain S-box-containing protein
VKTREEFLRALGEYAPDLILCDYKMPGLGAPAALEIVKERSPTTPFIVASGTIGEDVAVEMIKGGASDYVMKNNLPKLVPAVKRALKEVEERVERKKAEEGLLESEKRFLDVFYASKDAILILDGDKFVDCNEATAKMLGYATRQDFLMRHPSELSPPEQPDGRGSFEKANEMIKTACSQGFHQFEWIHRKANGEDFLVEVSLTPIVLHRRSMLYCLWRDLTERKKTAEEAKKRFHELDVFYKASMGREERILELKKQVAELEEKLKGEGTQPR